MKLPGKLLPLLLLIPYLGCMLWILTQMEYSLAWVMLILPVGIFGGYLMVTNFRNFLYLMVFLTPLSVNLEDIGAGVGLSLPMEIMLAVSAILAIALFLWDGLPPRELLRHPVTIIILVQFLWIITTSTTSTATSVSAKFTVARLTYLIVFYLLFSRLFFFQNNIRRFIWTYSLGLLPVMIYSVFRLGQIGFGRKYSPDMAEPFFDDHTVFGACLAMLIPIYLIWSWNRKKQLVNLQFKKLFGPILVLSIATLILSFSRAAWLSLIVAGVFYLLLRLKVSFKMVLAGFLALLAVGFILRGPLVDQMRKNDNVSGDDILKTAKSVTNVSSDESNAERVNRWSCAVRMAEDKPWFGFGPGTYERNYPRYQIRSEMTRISSMDGDRGDAHSEYLTALSEQGFIGLFIWLTLIFSLIWAGMRAYYRAPDEISRKLVLGLFLGLITYFTHGLVNSFLDIEKAATLFWGMSAAIVCLDCKHKVIS